MKVLDLQCEAMHVFEGWFASEEDYLSQVTQALVRCPVCGNGDVSKRLSAPRLNFGASGAQQVVDTPVAAPVASDPIKALQQQWLMACREIVANTVDVGSGFAEEARKIHYGEAPERAIRGQATPQETHSLLDEGIAVMPMLLPEGMVDPSH
jgi:hypothetical protein